jgi:hypothetical protein
VFSDDSETPDATSHITKPRGGAASTESSAEIHSWGEPFRSEINPMPTRMMVFGYSRLVVAAPVNSRADAVGT